MALITGTSDIPGDLQGWYDRNLLERAVPAELHGLFLQSRPVPKNVGTRINFRRYGSLAVATTPLGEGLTGDGKKMTNTDIYATLKQYGDFVTISDFEMQTGLDPILVEAGEVLGEQMGLTSDTLDRDVLMGGTSVRYAGDVASRSAITTAPVVADLQAIIRMLEGGNAKKIRHMIVGGAKIGTRPVAPGFYAITHTDMRQDYEALPGFTKVEEYSSQQDVREEEIGGWGNLRVLVTTNAKIYLAGGAAVGTTGLVSSDSTNIDVYTTLILAANAAGKVPLQAGTVKNIVKTKSGTSDPLDQRATSGWKMVRTCKILNDAFMVRFEHPCTAL